MQYLPYAYLVDSHIILFTIVLLEVGWEGTVLVLYGTQSCSFGLFEPLARHFKRNPQHFRWDVAFENTGLHKYKKKKTTFTLLFGIRINNPFSAGATFFRAVQRVHVNTECRQSERQAIYGSSRNLYLCFSRWLASLHTRKKDNPGKEAYKLAHGHAREQIGAVEVNDKASFSHENQGRSGK